MKDFLILCFVFVSIAMGVMAALMPLLQGIALMKWIFG